MSVTWKDPAAIPSLSRAGALVLVDVEQAVGGVVQGELDHGDGAEVGAGRLDEVEAGRAFNVLGREALLGVAGGLDLPRP